MFDPRFVSLLNEQSLSVAAFASEEWHGLSMRDVMLLVAGLVFCAVVIRFMTATSPDGSSRSAPPETEQGIEPGAQVQPNHITATDKIKDRERLHNDRVRPES